ncbi:hypothetical protein VUR80DRAFT_6553 [Thermomyces stellatus]
MWLSGATGRENTRPRGSGPKKKKSGKAPTGNIETSRVGQSSKGQPHFPAHPLNPPQGSSQISPERPSSPYFLHWILNRPRTCPNPTEIKTAQNSPSRPPRCSLPLMPANPHLSPLARPLIINTEIYPDGSAPLLPRRERGPGPARSRPKHPVAREKKKKLPHEAR